MDPKSNAVKVAKTKNKEVPYYIMGIGKPNVSTLRRVDSTCACVPHY